MRKGFGAFAVSLMLLSLVLPAVLAAEPTAQQILDSVTGSAAFTTSGEATVEMKVVSKRGHEKVHRVDLYRFDDGRGTTKQLVVFTAPADVKGTKFLSINTTKSEQMWLYLPAVGRERVIAGSAVKGKFMGTDFTFEEIGGDIAAYAKDYKPVRQRDKTVSGRSCYVLQLTAKAAKSEYSSITMAVDKDSRIPLHVEFYNRSKRLAKELTSSDLRRNNKGEWQPYLITMRDVGSGSTTTVRILKSTAKAVSDEFFTLRYLRR